MTSEYSTFLFIFSTSFEMVKFVFMVFLLVVLTIIVSGVLIHDSSDQRVIIKRSNHALAKLNFLYLFSMNL
jgi:hypothetical protein